LRTPHAKLAGPATAPVVPVAQSAPVAATAGHTKEAPASHDPELVAGTHSADEVTSPASKPETTRTDSERYAARQSRDLEGYRGGDAVVITTSTLLIVLVVLLIVLIIT
jgi:hypothetical protein